MAQVPTGCHPSRENSRRVKWSTIRFHPLGKQENAAVSIHPYRRLGRTGLSTSPLALGAGTFGKAWGEGWSIDKKEAEAIFHTFLDGGQNHIDVADFYQAGEAEEWVGEFLQTRGNRDRVILTTKAALSTDPENANGGGNGRVHMMEALEASLRRLKTDHVDLYYAHHWDTLTPVEEVMRTFEDMVRSGKVRYIGISNFPAWFLGQAHMFSRWQGIEPVAALQMEYNLLERSIEREYLPFAESTGTAVWAWSVLANGLLTGRYQIDLEGRKIVGEGRVTKTWVTDQSLDPFTPRALATLEVLAEISKELDSTPAQVALAWTLARPGIGGAVIGASKVSQVQASLQALELELSSDQQDRLSQASSPPPCQPYAFHEGPLQQMIHGNAQAQP